MNEQGQTLMEIMNQIEGVELKEKHGGRFAFRMHMTAAMESTPLEALELSVRAYNSLKRAGYHTVGELVEAVSSGKNLGSIRNCGKRSIREIMEHLFLFQYYLLRPEKREAYLREVIQMNLQQAGR